jgi:hypothetical protein
MANRKRPASIEALAAIQARSAKRYAFAPTMNEPHSIAAKYRSFSYDYCQAADWAFFAFFSMIRSFSRC